MAPTKRKAGLASEINIHRGLALKDALRIAEQLGVRSSYRHGTGEIRLDLAGHRSVMVNSRRKDLSRAALVLLKRANELQLEDSGR